MHQQISPQVLSLPTAYRPTAPTNRPIQLMKRQLPSQRIIHSLLQPENDLEKRLLETSEFRTGMIWGEPRFGHPEGKVFLHVREVLDNIDRIHEIHPHQREHLRLIAIAHDAFKFAEDRSHPRDWSKHHGLLARRFMEKYTSERQVLDVIETHDDAYYAWRNSRLDAPAPENGGKTLERLFDRVGHCLQLYYLFFKCDTQTGDKTQASLKWFERMTPGISLTRVKE